MNRLSSLVPACAVLLPLLAAPIPSPAAACCAEEEPAGAASSAGLERIAALAGTWVALDEAGEPTDRVISEIRVTAGGSAVLETLFPGTGGEMISVYHVDEGRLMLTHYCVMGNQPTYEVTAGEEDDELVFRCRGGGNLSDHDRAHMHEGRLRFVGEERIDTRWTALAAGEVVERVALRLQRR